MKQLKFMLAAATVIGLATAAQAETQVVNKPIYSEDFDTNFTVGDKVTADTVGFDYNGSENDSEIVEVTSGDNALKVNTGTDPLLRAIDFSQAARPVDHTAEKFQKLYIDTKVKFTVTPSTDTVVASKDENGKYLDKLMIYLKEVNVPAVVEDGVEVTPATTVTNLRVKAAMYTAAQPPQKPASFAEVEGDVVVSNFSAEPNKWYRLVVTSKLHEKGFVVFGIQIAEDGEDTLVQLKNTAGLVNTDDTMFPSLQGINGSDAAKTVTYVGFAGEGYVDDLVFTKDVEEETVVNFTFAIDIDGGVSSVVYTIGEGESAVDATITADAAAITVASGSKVTLKTINLNALYVLASDSAKENDVKTISAAGESFVVKTSALTGEGESAVPAGTTATQIGITNAEFEKADNAQLNSLVKWATSTGKGSLDLVNSMTFDANGNPSGDGKTAAEAYLLDCATTEVESKKDEFKLTITFDENGVPVVNGPEGAATYKNGKIVLKGREKLSEGDWVDKTDGHKFFKAFLTK